MRNFQDTFETRKRLFISAFSICMTVPLRKTQASTKSVNMDIWVVGPSNQVFDYQNFQNFGSFCHNTCRSLKRRAIWKPLITFFRRTNALSVGLKMKPLWAFSCVKAKTNSNFAVKLAERSNRSFLRLTNHLFQNLRGGSYENSFPVVFPLNRKKDIISSRSYTK